MLSGFCITGKASDSDDKRIETFSDLADYILPSLSSRVVFTRVSDASFWINDNDN